MGRYTAEVVLHGRINVIVEADSEEEALRKLNEDSHPDIPDLDKLYAFEAVICDEIDG